MTLKWCDMLPVTFRGRSVCVCDISGQFMKEKCPSTLGVGHEYLADMTYLIKNVHKICRFGPFCNFFFWDKIGQHFNKWIWPLCWVYEACVLREDWGRFSRDGAWEHVGWNWLSPFSIWCKALIQIFHISISIGMLNCWTPKNLLIQVPCLLNSGIVALDV